MSENPWIAATQRNPDHAKNYAQRWRDLVAEGHDIDGEARTIDALAHRGARILDAGAGTGRVGGYLAARGHRVVGVDLDPHLVEVARADFPEAEWHVGDLAELDLSERGERRRFDLVVMAGNVLTFVPARDRLEVLHRVRRHLEGDGRFVCGFGARRGYEFADFFADAQRAGLRPTARFSTWDLRPPNDDFLVAVLEP